MSKHNNEKLITINDDGSATANRAEQIKQQQETAITYLPQDVLDWAVGRIAQQEATMRVAWSIINAATSQDRRKIKEILDQVVAMAKSHKKLAKDKDGLSRASIYRRIGIILRVIQSRIDSAGKEKIKVNLTFLRENPQYLLLVKRDELAELAEQYPTSVKLAKAFPVEKVVTDTDPTGADKVAKTVPAAVAITPPKALIKPVATAESVMASIAEIHSSLAILGMMLKEVRIKQTKFDAEAIVKMKYFKAAAAQGSRECGKIINAHPNTDQRDLL